MLEQVGRYEIRSELGRGGMATVFLAHDPYFSRDVALKVLPRAFMHDQNFLDRFAREARMIASLEHMAIVPVYDYGEQDGLPFLVMRYMPGGSLAERLMGGPISLRQASSIMVRLADALEYTHSQGIIHRDLKPGNILFDARDNPFLSDFGIAKLAEATANLTGSAIIGTPAYMSPEQVHGNEKIDGRSDVYALGIILFQMLTGKLPYEADTPARQLMAHVLDPVPRIHDVREDLPAACEAVISRAMAKNREQRYDTPSNLAAAIAGIQEQPTQVSRSPLTAAQTRAVVSEPEEESPSATDQTEFLSEPAQQAPVSPPPIPEAIVTEVVDVATVVEPPTPAPPLIPGKKATSSTPLMSMETIVEDEVEEAPTVEPFERPAPIPQAAVRPGPMLWWRRIPVWGWVGIAILILVGLFILFSGGPGGGGTVADNNGSADIDAEGTAVSAFIEVKWDQEFDVTTLTKGGSLWAVVMSQGDGRSRQTWHAQGEFPGEFIETKWKEGFDVTSLAYGDRRWVVVMAQQAADSRQIWHTAPEFPKEFIEAKWEEGFDVSELMYGGGFWALVMEMTEAPGQQTWHVAGDFPGEFIEQKWEEGFDVTSLSYGDRRWALVMSRTDQDQRQTWHTAGAFPSDFIEQKWREDFDVSQVAYGNGLWAVILVQDTVGRRQTWQTGRRFN